MYFLRSPLDNSDEIFKKFANIPGAVHRGSDLEQFLFINGSRKNRVLLVAHADTKWENVEVEPDIVLENGKIRNKNGGLGADDRAGCAIVYLLKDIGHSILITNGEEHGGQGSKWLMKCNPDIARKINDDHQFVVEFDRRNAFDFKCYDVGTDEFRDYVSQVTGYTEPDRTSSTDIVTICRDICGVNLSIGYYNEHREDEYLVIDEWENTLNICRKWLSESELPRFCLNKN